MVNKPKVVIGIPLYNNTQHLREALESLLAQRYRDFAIVLTDDSTTDEIGRIVREYEEVDSKIVYKRNSVRLGYLRNARKCFELAKEKYPGMEFFAWASDHDAWHPRWLGTLVHTLESRPEAVLAYPLNIRITDQGDHDSRALLWFFDNAGIRDPWRRFRRTCFGMSAGNMIYGLFRAKTLEQAGVLRPVLIPDRLLMAEISLYGESVQVPEILWYRRYIRLANLQRQVVTLFPDEAPSYLRMPWWLTHAAWIAYVYGIAPRHPLSMGRTRAFWLGLTYLMISLFLRIHRIFRVIFVRFRASVLRQIKKAAIKFFDRSKLWVVHTRVRLGQFRIKLSWWMGKHLSSLGFKRTGEGTTTP